MDKIGQGWYYGCGTSTYGTYLIYIMMNDIVTSYKTAPLGLDTSYH